MSNNPSRKQREALTYAIELLELTTVNKDGSVSWSIWPTHLDLLCEVPAYLLGIEGAEHMRPAGVYRATIKALATRNELTPDWRTFHAEMMRQRNKLVAVVITKLCPL